MIEINFNLENQNKIYIFLSKLGTNTNIKEYIGRWFKKIYYWQCIGYIYYGETLLKFNFYISYLITNFYLTFFLKYNNYNLCLNNKDAYNY